MTDPRFPNTMTLEQARVELRPLAEKGHDCPLCRQRVRIYRRNLANVHGRAIAALYAEHNTRFGHWPTLVQHRLSDIAQQGGYLLLGAHWGLLESEETINPDGGRPGYWRVSALGESWILGQQSVPKYADIYNRRCWGLSGDLVTREDVLGEQFDFDALIARQADAPNDLLSEAA